MRSCEFFAHVHSRQALGGTSDIQMRSKPWSEPLDDFLRCFEKHGCQSRVGVRNFAESTNLSLNGRLRLAVGSVGALPSLHDPVEGNCFAPMWTERIPHVAKELFRH